MKKIISVLICASLMFSSVVSAQSFNFDRMSEKPEIDGIITPGEWDGALTFAADTEECFLGSDEKWGGKSDISMTGAIGYDDTYIYLMAVVSDDIHSPDTVPGNMWKGDSLQFAIDIERNMEELSSDLNEFGMALMGEETYVFKYLAPTGMRTGLERDFPACAVRGETDTTYEIAIPWNKLVAEDKKISKGSEIGFSILVNDNDGGDREGWMEFGSGIGMNKDKSLYHILKISDDVDIVMEDEATEDPTVLKLNINNVRAKNAKIIKTDNDYMVSAEEVFKSLGAKVYINDNNITIRTEDSAAELEIGSSTATSGEETKELKDIPYMDENDAMVPLFAVSDMVGAEYSYYPENNLVSVQIIPEDATVIKPIQDLLGGAVDFNRDFQSSGVKTTRIGYDRLSKFWDGTRAMPEVMDSDMLKAYDLGITDPVLMLTPYTTWEGSDVVGYDRWFKIGYAFAERFRPNSAFLLSKGIKDWGITHYTAFNEPDNPGFFAEPLTPEGYYDSIKGFADGVHAVDKNFKVSPHGFTEMDLFYKTSLIEAIVPLFNDGTLYSLDFHRYWDDQYVPMEGTYNYSIQAQFDDVKEYYGITRDIKYSNSEFNVKVSPDATPEDIEDKASKFLTAIWDELSVTGNFGQTVTDYGLVFNLTLPPTDDHGLTFGLATRVDPWTPNKRGLVYQMVINLCHDMWIVKSDPKETGEILVKGNGKTMVVWQNRTAWTNHLGNTFTINDIPEGATKVEVFRYNSWESGPGEEGKPAPYLTIELTERQKTLEISDLPTEETLMFYIDACEPEYNEVPKPVVEDKNETTDDYIEVENVKVYSPQSPYRTDPKMLTDGITDSVWESSTLSTDIYLELDSVTSVRKLALSLPENWKTNRIQTISVVGSIDGSEYTNMAMEKSYLFDQENNNKVEILTGASDVKYIKISVTMNNRIRKAQLSEIQVYQ